jgi:dihydroxyacetone kinase-like predicted kinase
MSEIVLANTVEYDRMGTVRKEERTMEINFVTAKNGKIELMSDKTVVVSSVDVEELTNTMYDHGLADQVYHSSSMDFASEDGFENDGDAWVIFDEALKMYNWVANGIAG